MKRFLNLFLVVAIVALGVNIMFAQATATGTIVGTAADKAGAVLVGAEVTATNKATGAVRNVQTNSTGDFRFEQEPAGTYAVKITQGGFLCLRAEP